MPRHATRHRVIQDSLPSMTTGIGTPRYMSPELLAGYKGQLSQVRCYALYA
jgi:hypothetical protein